MAAVAVSADCPESTAAAPPPTWVPTSMEIALIPPPLHIGRGGDRAEGPEGTDKEKDADRLCGPFPGLFLATEVARMIRPVRQIDTGLVEVIGPLEQVRGVAKCVRVWCVCVWGGRS
jgi:hypothetical protein